VFIRIALVAAALGVPLTGFTRHVAVVGFLLQANIVGRITSVAAALGVPLAWLTRHVTVVEVESGFPQANMVNRITLVAAALAIPLAGLVLHVAAGSLQANMFVLVAHVAAAL